MPCVRIDLDGEDLALVAATKAHGGTVDVVGIMDGDLAWIEMQARGLPEAALDALDAHFGQLFDEFRSDHGPAWTARGRLPPARLPHPILQTLQELLDQADAPWLHVRDGQATLYLLPFDDMELLTLEGRAKRRIAAASLEGDCQVRIGSIRLDDYRRWRAMLPEPLMARAQAH